MLLHAVALALVAVFLLSAPAHAQGTTVALRGTTTFENDLDVPMPGETKTGDFNPIGSDATTAANGENQAARGVDRATTAAIPDQDRGPVKPVARGPSDTAGTSLVPGGEALTAEAPRDNFDDDADVYEPLGIRAGSFLLLPSLEVTGGASDNIDSTTKGKAGGFYRIAPEVILRSNWSRHQLESTLKGSYKGYPWSDTADDPNLTTTTTVRLDLRDSTTLDLEGGYTLDRESSSSADVAPGTETTALVHQLRGAAGLTQQFGRLGVTGKGSIDRTFYTGGTRVGGGALDSETRNNSLLTASLRTSYEVSPAFKPFVEGALLERVYDEARDASGYRRDSSGYEAKVGAVIDLGAKLHAEGALGWHYEELRDSRFDPLEGLIAEASLVWSPSRLTTVTLSGETAFEPTTLVDSSGSTQYSGDIKIAHSLRRNLEVDAGLGLALRTYQGSGDEDVTMTGTAGLAWSLNRNLALTARYSYENLQSNRPGADYSANSIEVGLRMRR